MKRQLILGMFLCAVGLVFAAPAVEKPVIKVGVVMPMSGNSATFGEGARDGLLFCLKEHEGKTQFNYQIIFEDDRFESAKTNLAAKKLRNIDKVDVIISMWGQASSVIVPQLAGSDIINLSMDRWGTPFKSYPNDFVVGPGVEAYAQEMIKALKALEIKKLAMVTSALAGPVAYDKRLKELLNEHHIELVSYSLLPSDIRDFRTLILKIREAGPDALMNDLMAPQTEIFQRQMKEIGYSPMVISPSAFFIDVSPEYKEGVWYTLNASPRKDWAEKFRQAMSREPRYLSSFTYDGLSMLIAAAEQLPAGQKPTQNQIAAKLRNTKDFPAVLGVTSFQYPNTLSSPVSFYLIKEGRPREVSLEELVKHYKK